jgi:iron complex outermembrane recepter protein
MSKRSISLRRSLLWGAAIGSLSISSAWGQQTGQQAAPPADEPAVETVQQQQPAAPGAGGERIVVTGSRIARDVFTSSSPIEVITSESAQLEGLIDTAEILQGSTSAAGSVQYNNSYGAFVIEGGPGINSVSLRGLGAQRSLVLLNGRRPGPAGVRGQVGAFDLNVIPDSIISRVEVLKDGASSVYGSDAVAGVANIITRSSVDAPELTIQYNRPEDPGGASLQLNGAFGLNFDFGSLMVAAEYESRDALKNRDRSWAACTQDLAYDPTTGQKIDRIDRSILAGTDLAGCRNTQFNLVFDAVNSAIYIPSPNGVTQGPIPGYRLRANTPTTYEDVWNSPLYLNSDILAAVDRTSLYGKYDMDIAGLQWSTEALFTRREYESYQYRQFFPTIGGPLFYDIPGPFTAPAAYANFIPGLNGTEVVQPITIWPSNTFVNLDYYNVNSGLKGDFGGGDGYFGSWSWEVNASYSLSDGEYITNQILKETAGDINFPRPSDGLYVGPTYNPFDPAFLSGNYSQATYDLLTGMDRGMTTYEQTTFTGVVTGDLFQLPAGPLGAAFGAEYRTFEIDDTPGQGSQDDIYWGASTAQVTRGEDSVSEVFTELDIPVLRGLPGVEELTLNGSARWFDYDSYGSDSVWKAGFNWQIIPSVRVRGTKGTSYRAPALYELFLGDQTGFFPQLSVDPCIDWGQSSNENIRANCAAAGIPSNYLGSGEDATVITGGGAGRLQAENSEASTLGVIFTPTVLDLSFAIDYFDITIENQVAQLGPGTIGGGCYAAPIFPNAFCNLLTRAPSTDPTRAYNILTINDSYLNVNQQATHGIDYSVRYNHEFDFGDLTIDVKATQTKEDVNLLFSSAEESGFETSDFLGTVGDPEWVGDAQISFRRGDWTYSWFVEYVGEVDNSVFANEFFTYNTRPARRILRADDWLSHDFSLRWQGDKATVVFGVANAFNAQPPLFSNGAAQRIGNIALAGTNYDYRGRTLFLRVGTEF